MPDDEQTKTDDQFNPEAIAARLDKLGQGSDEDKVAEAEEKKLRARRKEGKTALEAAASKRLSKIGEHAVKRPTASGVVADDPFTAGVAGIGAWMRKNQQTTASIVSMVVLGIGVTFGWMYWRDHRNGQASALLGTAFAAENGPINAKDEDEDDESANTDKLYPTFKTIDDRRAAALAGFRKVEGKFSGTGAAVEARLGEASLLLDAKDAQGALAAYTDVKSSPLGQADPQTQGRAYEGIGFAHELLATQDAANVDKHLDDAVVAFRAVEAVDVQGFKELGMYDRARVLVTKGDKSQAVEVLKDVLKRVNDAGEQSPFAYLKTAVQSLLRSLDPSALPPPAPKTSPGGPDMSDPKIQELLRQIQEQSKSKGAPPADNAPAPAAPPADKETPPGEPAPPESTP